MFEQISEITEKPIQPEAAPEISVQLPMPKKNFSRITILLIVILLIVTGVAYAVMQISKKQTPVVLPTAPPPNVRPIDALPTPTSDETANWKTYTNEKYGFEFKYPINFELEKEHDLALENENDIYLFLVNFSSDKSGMGGEFSLEVNDKESWEEILKYRKWQIIGHLSDKIDKESQIKVGDKTAVRLDYTYLDNMGSGMSMVIIEGNYYFYTLHSSFELANQILATFKFTN